MKSTIRKILREQFDQDVEKNQTYTKILNDLLKNFNKNTIGVHSLSYDELEASDFDLYSKTVEFATIVVGGYLKKTYGLISPQENDLRSSLLTDWIRATYKDGNGVFPGDTIEMVEMYDDPHGIEAGTIGIVKDVASFEFGGNWEEHIEVDWENGRTLKVMLPYDKIKKIAAKIKKSTNCLYLGRGYNFPVALEGALKLKEISYIHAEGYPAAEMKHGPIALIDKNMPSIIIATNKLYYDKILSNVQEIKSRKGKIIAVVFEGDKEISKIADYTIEVPETIAALTPFVTTIPLQLLSYHIAVKLGRNVDQPRNLAKSVTVE